MRLLSSDDKVRSRFTQQGWAAYLTPSSGCFLAAGALQKDRDRTRPSHLLALLVPLPPTGSVLERLEPQRRALPQGARPNAREAAAEPRAKMFAQRFGHHGGRSIGGSGQERTWSRRKTRPKVGKAGYKKLFYVAGIRARFGGRNPAPGNGA